VGAESDARDVCPYSVAVSGSATRSGAAAEWAHRSAGSQKWSARSRCLRSLRSRADGWRWRWAGRRPSRSLPHQDGRRASRQPSYPQAYRCSLRGGQVVPGFFQDRLLTRGWGGDLGQSLLACLAHAKAERLGDRRHRHHLWGMLSASRRENARQVRPEGAEGLRKDPAVLSPPPRAEISHFSVVVGAFPEKRMLGPRLSDEVRVGWV
jgi:hypothetical protein